MILSLQTVLQTLRNDVHRTTLAHRALDRIVHTRIFEEAYNIETDHRDLLEALQYANVKWVEGWIERTIKLEVGELSMKELRIKARQYGILRYTSLSKDALIVALTQAIHHAREAQEAAVVVPSAEEGPSLSNSNGAGRTVPTPAGC